MKWNELVQKWKRFHQRARWVPFDDAPLSEWEYFAQSAPRWLVEETIEKWIKDFSATAQWDTVYALLKRRCNSFEYPMLPQAFIKANQERVCVVAEGSSAVHISVCAECSEKEYPFYVVERNGKFRGIAVTYGLVIAGVMNKLCIKEKEREVQSINVTRSLSLKDCHLLFQSQDEVSKMLLEIGLHPLFGRYWTYTGVWECQTDRDSLTLDEAFIIAKI